MPLSALAQNALNESERISNENKAKKKAIADQQEAERKQAEKEYNDFINEQTEIQKQIDIFEAEEKAQADLILNQERARQKIIDDRNAVNLPYANKIAELEASKAKALNEAHTSVWGGSGSRNRSEYNDLARKISGNYGTAIEAVSIAQRNANNQFEFNLTYPGAQLGRTALNQVKAGESPITAYERQQENLEARKQAQRQTAINQSQSQLGEGRAQLNKTVAQYSQQKETNTKTQTQAIYSKFTATPTKAGDLKEKATPPARELYQPIQESLKTLTKENLKSYQATQKAKAETLEKIIQKQPKIERIAPNITNKSNAFLTKPPPSASSIISKSTAQSDKSFFTFEETQKQQKELFQKITTAKTSQEATKLKEEYQKLNPYVGTPQTARTKQGLAEQGVLIDLKLNFKEEDLVTQIPGETITEYQITIGDRTITTQDEATYNKILKRLDRRPPTITPGETITETSYQITKGDRTLTVKNEATANKILERLNRAPPDTPSKYIFQDPTGKTIKPTIGELFSYNNYLLDQSAKLPNKADFAFNKIIQENPQAFTFDPNVASGKTKQVNIENIYEQANKDPINRGMLNIIANPGETLSGKAIGDLIAVGSSAIFNKSIPQESEAVKSFSGKIQNDFKASFQKVNYEFSEGQKELIGEAIGEYGLARFIGGAPSIIQKVYETNIVSPKTLKIAEEIAENIRIGGRDPATEKFISQFPEMTQAEKTKLRSLTGKETVGIEQIDPRTVLIKRGTELSEVDTPYIVVKNTGRKSHGSLYSIYTVDKPGAYSKILIEGQTNKRLIEINTADLTKQNKKIAEIQNKINKSNAIQKLSLKNKLKNELQEKTRLEQEISILSVKELNQGQKIADDLTQYPASRFNVKQVIDNSYLVKVGTSEKVGMEGLRETPLAVIEKIETQKVKTGTIIHETQKRDPIKSMNIDSGAKELPKGGKNTDWTKPPTSPPVTTKIIKTFSEPPGAKIDLNIPGGKGSNITTLSSKQKKETLERTINAQLNKDKIKDKIDTSQFNKLSSISLNTSTLATRGIYGTSLGTSSKLRTEGATVQKQFSATMQAQRTAQKTELSTELETKIKLRTDIITGLKTKQETTQKQKPWLNPKYSLITLPGLRDKEDVIPIVGIDEGLKEDQIYTYKLITKQTTIPKFPTPTRTKITTTTKIMPGIPFNLNFDKEIEVRKKKQGKPSISFFRYNTNTESVGRYIEQAPDISTGKTSKVIKKIDRLEKQINTPQYREKQTRQDNRQYDKELTVYKKSNGSLKSKGFIPNISKPRGEKATKELKKLSFKLKFF